jgi:hypothetical protein
MARGKLSGSISKSATGIRADSARGATGWTVPRITRVQPESNATAAMASVQPRKHRESVLTTWFIVSSAGPLAGQARHRDDY